MIHKIELDVGDYICITVKHHVHQAGVAKYQRLGKSVTRGLCNGELEA